MRLAGRNRRAAVCTSIMVPQSSGAVGPPVNISVAWKVSRLEAVAVKSEGESSLPFKVSGKYAC